MRNKFSFGELSHIIDASKKPDVVKIASGDGDNAPLAEAMESVCRVADALDEMGKSELADELMTSAQRLVAEKIKIAEEEDDEETGEEGGEEVDEVEEVMTVKCPHCEKDFEVVVEYEDGDLEVETKEEEKKEIEEGKEESGEGHSTEGLEGL